MSDKETAPRVVLVHAVPVAMAPVEAAFKRLWPQVRRSNLLDDGLPADLERAGRLTPELHERIARLVDHAVGIGAQGVLFTCSAFGDAIAAAAARAPIPVLKPDQAMFDEALQAGRRIGMLATFAPAVPNMERDFRAAAKLRGIDVDIESVCVPEAMNAARAGDTVRHNQLLVEATSRLAHCDAVMLAQFSTSVALDDVQSVLACPVLSSPDAAVALLKKQLG
ncbi:aspartate/glutamate racemase family protein [Hydrogenophaga sp. SL48]|uniref:aspartate/glutamate racemase family protein n=1 Tax=Hydrogenophaga sp. SL48 TaxID=2806347 RepID=UPI001F43B12F|nr:aspartate/glutamate racemase family protein [Hydrogenophaga sp. SL48]UJW83143.1 arylsulfatase [Hydrogenophaga sp. SL48]